jgi:hypothetical protein
MKDSAWMLGDSEVNPVGHRADQSRGSRRVGSDLLLLFCMLTGIHPEQKSDSTLHLF